VTLELGRLMSGTFDPRQYLRQLDNGEPYLDVKWRLHWLRSEHPDAQIETDLIAAEADSVVCKATVRLPDGGSASGHASATRTPDMTHIELAETRAIGRALAALGYGAEYADPDAFATQQTERGAPPVSLRPVQPAQMTGADDRRERPQPMQSAPRMRPVPVDDRDRDDREPPQQVRPTRAEPQRELREVRTREPEYDAEPPPLPVPMGRASDLRPTPGDGPRQKVSEDVLWNKFWEWARRRGYRDAAHLKELLGVDVNALTPGEVRDRLKRYELENPPGE
jgi:hypothetical protein